MKPRLYTSLVAVLALFASSTEAADLVGASGVLERIKAQSASSETAQNPLELLKQHLADYTRESASLPAETAALRWLSLYDEYMRLPASSRHSQDYDDRVDMGRLVQSLPPPEAWDALSALLLAGSENATGYDAHGRRLFALLLKGDLAAQRAACAALIAKVEADKQLEDYQRQDFIERVSELSDAIEAVSADGGVNRVAGFERELSRHEKAVAAGDETRGRYMQVPDLVDMAGRDVAAPLLRRVLAVGAQPDVDGKATRQLFKEIVLADIDTSTMPMWSLVEGSEDEALYQALMKKFPESTGRDREREGAWSVHVVGLIAAGQIDEAVREVLAKPERMEHGLPYPGSELLAEMERAGRRDALVNFMHGVLTANPGINFWSAYIQLSARQSDSGEALALLRASIARTDQPADVTSRLKGNLASALLADDQVDEGVALLLSVVRGGDNAPAKPAAQSASEMPSLAELAQMGVEITPELLEVFAKVGADAGGGADASMQNAILTLLKIGRLMGRADLVGEAVTAGLDQAEKNTDDGRVNYLIREVVDALVRTERVAEAETLLVNRLTRARANERANYRNASSSVMLELASLYGRLGRHQDVLNLFVDYPDWMGGDLSDFGVQGVGHYSGGEPRPFELVADALIATGRGSEAVPVLRRMILRQPGYDGGYERLEKINPPGYAELLEEAARIDRYQERPLIWKARLQLARGDVAAAEKTIRAAIAIDPSDGEQGKGDRMRAYAVLADVLDQRGDAEQAAMMRGAVAAIRLSEDADDWWNAGLLSRAVKRYEDALLRFADAYCIQARLALRYSDMGDDANAEKHYLRAFELMPSSFGRIESHCFGCEGAFRGRVAQNAADKVFTRLAESMSDRPQVFYLLGYLRDSQERYAESVAYYRKAVELDPDYLNAWERLQSSGQEVGLAAAERESIALAILRLDPAGIHSSPSTEAFVDLKRLWTVILEAEKSLPPFETGPVFTLSAAAAQREMLAKAGGDVRTSGSWENRAPRLREKLTADQRVSGVMRLLEPNRYY